jgi:hypothetical protein
VHSVGFRWPHRQKKKKTKKKKVYLVLEINIFIIAECCLVIKLQSELFLLNCDMYQAFVHNDK